MVSMRSSVPSGQDDARAQAKTTSGTFIPQHTVQMQQSGRLQNDGGTENTCPAHEKGTQTGDDPIGGAQVRRTLAAAIEASS
jgi:hypothetical protein